MGWLFEITAEFKKVDSEFYKYIDKSRMRDYQLYFWNEGVFPKNLSLTPNATTNRCCSWQISSFLDLGEFKPTLIPDNKVRYSNSKHIEKCNSPKTVLHFSFSSSLESFESKEPLFAM